MSTRASICVHNDHERFYIYRHSDGYPDGPHGIVAGLESVLPYAWPSPRFEPSDFSAAVIGAWKDGGGQIRMSNGHDTHCDTEFQYNVTSKNGQLWVEVQDVGFLFDDDATEETRDRKTLFAGPLPKAILHFAREAA